MDRRAGNRALSEVLADLETRWAKARKTKRVSRALASAVVYGFVTGLSGATGTTILVGCLLVAIGGAAFPVGRQGHQWLAGVAGFICYLAGAAIFIHPVTFRSHANAATSSGRLHFSLTSQVIDQQDQSTAQARVTSAPESGALPGGEKVGTKQLDLIISNSYAHPVYVTDIRVAELRTGPPLRGTLFQSLAQGVGQNDRMGADLSQRPPVVRHMTVTGTLGDPFFAFTHLVIAAHQSEILSITMFAGAPRSYSWSFRVFYDAGSGTRSVLVKGRDGLLTLTGYVQSYGRAFELVGDAWTGRSAVNFCPATGSDC